MIRPAMAWNSSFRIPTRDRAVCPRSRPLPAAGTGALFCYRAAFVQRKLENWFGRHRRGRSRGDPSAFGQCHAKRLHRHKTGIGQTSQGILNSHTRALTPARRCRRPALACAKYSGGQHDGFRKQYLACRRVQKPNHRQVQPPAIGPGSRHADCPLRTP